MKSLKEVAEANFFLALAGVTFSNPAFRRLTGQLPYNVQVHTIFADDEAKIEKKFKRLITQSEDPFIFVVRDVTAHLKEVLFVPSKEKRETAAVSVLPKNWLEADG
jgi:hypothetical protein